MSTLGRITDAVDHMRELGLEPRVIVLGTAVARALAEELAQSVPLRDHLSRPPPDADELLAAMQRTGATICGLPVSVELGSTDDQHVSVTVRRRG